MTYASDLMDSVLEKAKKMTVEDYLALHEIAQKRKAVFDNLYCKLDSNESFSISASDASKLIPSTINYQANVVVGTSAIQSSISTSPSRSSYVPIDSASDNFEPQNNLALEPSFSLAA